MGGKYANEPVIKSKTPEPPIRDDDIFSYVNAHNIHISTDLNPNDIVFEPYESSSTNGSDKESLSEEVIPIDMDNLEQLELDSEHSIQTSGPISPRICDEDIKFYEHLTHFQVLKHTIFFGTIFTNEERDSILHNLVQVEYEKDKILFSQGGLPEYIYIMVEGTVEFIQTDVKGNFTTLQKVYTGSVIGETDIYNHNRYEYYCVSCEPVIILQLASSVVKQLLSNNRRYELYVRRSLCSRNWKQMIWINSILQGKQQHNEQDLTISSGQQRLPRKSPVQFTLDMIINEDADLNVSINQYVLHHEISIGINSRVGDD